jgi:hypothetical protein
MPKESAVECADGWSGDILHTDERERYEDDPSFGRGTSGEPQMDTTLRAWKPSQQEVCEADSDGLEAHLKALRAS